MESLTLKLDDAEAFDAANGQIFTGILLSLWRGYQRAVDAEGTR